MRVKKWIKQRIVDNVSTQHTQFIHMHNFAISDFYGLIHQSTVPTTITMNLKPILYINDWKEFRN